jgi:hypothetical protein
MRRIFVAILLASSCIYGRAQSQDCASMMQQALEITEFNQSIDDAIEMMNSDAFMRQAGGGKGDVEVINVVRPILQKNFNAQSLKKELQDRMAAHCNSQQMALVLQELQSPVVAQMMRLDAEARTPEGKQKLQRYARAIQVAPPSDTRLSMIQAFDERAGITAFAMDSMIAATRGMMVGSGAPAEAFSQIDLHRAEIKTQIQNSILLALSSAYRNVGQADLEAFGKELSTQPLKGFYDQARKAFVAMTEARCTAIGKELRASMEARQK